MNNTWMDRCVSLNKETGMLLFNLNEIAIMYSKIEKYITKDYESTIDFWFKGYRIQVIIKTCEECKNEMVTIRSVVKTDNKYQYVLSSHLMVYDLPNPDYKTQIRAEHNIIPLIRDAEYQIKRLKETNDCYLLE